VNLTVPWHRANFVLSARDISVLVRRSSVADRVTVRPVSSRGYLAFATHARGGVLRWAAGAYLTMASLPALRTSSLNPLTTVLLEYR
jgi:hypothetical protein